MPPVQFLPSVRDSETITCRHCRTRQYPGNGTCVRCRCALGVDYLSFQVRDQLKPRTVNDEKHLARAIGVLIRSLRKRRGLSQSQLAMRAANCVARTYLSKAECGHVLLPLSKLLQVAEALGLTAVILRFETTESLAVHQSNNHR